MDVIDIGVVERGVFGPERCRQGRMLVGSISWPEWNGRGGGQSAADED